MKVLQQVINVEIDLHQQVTASQILPPPAHPPHALCSRSRPHARRPSIATSFMPAATLSSARLLSPYLPMHAVTLQSPTSLPPRPVSRMKLLKHALAGRVWLDGDPRRAEA